MRASSVSSCVRACVSRRLSEREGVAEREGERVAWVLGGEKLTSAPPLAAWYDCTASDVTETVVVTASETVSTASATVSETAAATVSTASTVSSAISKIGFPATALTFVSSCLTVVLLRPETKAGGRRECERV